LNCNADMYALESRVTRSINGRAVHFDIPKWRDPLQPQLPYRISAQAASLRSLALPLEPDPVNRTFLLGTIRTFSFGGDNRCWPLDTN
jgi:hypothetical protein